MTDFGAARPSDLYTGENPVEAGGLEPLETPELVSLDARILEAQSELLDSQGELIDLLTPQAGETGRGVLGNLLRFCDRVTDAIGGFFITLFGSKELPPSKQDAMLAVVSERLELQREHLEELQIVRADLVEVRSRLQELQHAEPELLVPQLQQFRTGFAPIPELLKEFAQTPLVPETSRAIPSLEGIDILDRARDYTLPPVDPLELRPEALAPHLTPFMPLISELSQQPQPELPEPELQERVVGDPVGDAAYWHPQGGDMTCAIVDQEMILDKLAGDPNAASEFDLVQESVARGWARFDGASIPAHVGELLESRGIRTEVVMREDVVRLAERLAAGQEAIVGVRGEILWNIESPLQTGSDLNPANHAIWVTGATVVEREGKTEVVSLHVNDSGDPNGRGREVPVELFLRAWAASDNHVIYAIPGQR